MIAGQRPLRAARHRRGGGARLHPLRRLPLLLPHVAPGRRARLRLALLRPDRRGADAAAGGDGGRALAASCRSCRRCAAPATTPARSGSRCTTCSCACAARTQTAAHRRDRMRFRLWSRAWRNPVAYRPPSRWRAGPAVRAAADGRGACRARAAAGPTSATCPRGGRRHSAPGRGDHRRAHAPAGERRRGERGRAPRGRGGEGRRVGHRPRPGRRRSGARGAGGLGRAGEDGREVLRWPEGRGHGWRELLGLEGPELTLGVTVPPWAWRSAARSCSRPARATGGRSTW